MLPSPTSPWPTLATMTRWWLSFLFMRHLLVYQYCDLPLSGFKPWWSRFALIPNVKHLANHQSQNSDPDWLGISIQTSCHTSKADVPLAYSSDTGPAVVFLFMWHPLIYQYFNLASRSPLLGFELGDGLLLLEMLSTQLTNYSTSLIRKGLSNT